MTKGQIALLGIVKAHIRDRDLGAAINSINSLLEGERTHPQAERDLGFATMAAEYGYKACEKGDNIQMMLINLRKLLKEGKSGNSSH